MTALEIKILAELARVKKQNEEFDAYCKELYDKHMARAAIQTDDYWRKDCERSAKFHLSGQKHGYEFLETWKNAIANAMYGRIYHKWHSAQAGRYKGTGHGAYATTELTDTEIDIINRVFVGLVNHGYLKLSKSGKMAKYTK